MLEKITKQVVRFIFLPHIRRVERKIGYKLVFQDIPGRFINGIVAWDMTALWKNFGLALVAGSNYWTIGKPVNGVSSRFLRDCPEYQSWLGGYIVKLKPGASWTLQDHLRLAVADQTSWLRHHGDPAPLADVEGWSYAQIDTIRTGPYSGALYEGAGMTHSDVGNRYGSVRAYFYFATLVMASLFNFSNPDLRIKGSVLKPPKAADRPYETLKLPVYVAIFDVGEDVHVILYGNGAVVPKEEGDADTLLTIKEDLLRGMRACDIVKI